jgi:hypothetical protein
LVQIERRIMVWAGEGSASLLEGQNLGGHAAVVLAKSEEEVWAAMPPRGNALLYLLDVERCLTASPGFVAAVAARPSTWPPIVVFGFDSQLVKASSLSPNSRICGTPQTLVSSLADAAHYWVNVNEAMLLE